MTSADQTWLVCAGRWPLLVAALLVPLALLVAAFAPAWRRRLAPLLVVAPLPALAVALFAGDATAVVLDPQGLEITLSLDGPRALLLGAVALLWSLAGAYAATSTAGDRHRAAFCVWWLLSLTGCIGVFLSGDLASWYLFFALVSLSAYGLVVHDGTPAARRAAAIYLVLTILGEGFLLVGFVLLAAADPGTTLHIETLVAALPAAPLRTQTVVFLLLGLGLKAGLFPLHCWLPLAHPAAPTPASAVLSGAIIKTGIVGLIVMLPFDALSTGGAASATSYADIGAWRDRCSVVIVTIGFFTAFYGALVGVTQRNPKTILAYSSVSQMGLVVAILGAGLAAGDASGAASAGVGDDPRHAASFYALHHALVKGALFLGLGVLAGVGAAVTGAVGAWRRRLVLIAMALLALSLAGLPLTSGALAKLLSKPVLGDGTAGTLATLSAIASAWLMTHFLITASRKEPMRLSTAPIGLSAPWAALALAAFVVPWMVFAEIPSPASVLTPDDHAGIASPFTLAALWKALWPVVLGAALAWIASLGRIRLPAIPEGDLVVPVERAVHLALRGGPACDRADTLISRWPIAGAGLLLVILLIATIGSV